MLACARIGAIHSVVFGGFSAEALRDRINDQGAKLLITADGGWRRGNVVPLKKIADEALEDTPTIENVVLVMRTHTAIDVKEGRDHWWHRLMADAPGLVQARVHGRRGHPLHPLHVGHDRQAEGHRPHDRRLHDRHATRPSKLVFDLKDDDIFWCTADIGWVTGHSYVVYGPLANGATCLMYEGAPDTPGRDRFWDIIERHGVTILYTAPTAIRTFMKWGTEFPDKHDLSSLRLLGTVGEPINPEAWIWYQKTIGKGRCPIVDTWWQTETGCILITPLPGVTKTKPGSATVALPGHRAEDPRRARATRSRSAAATSRSRSRGRRCSARSGATTSATQKTYFGRSGTRASTSRVTARGATRTATSGSWAAWTTS